LQALVEEDAMSWSKMQPEVWDLAARFRASGGRTALLTNNVPPLMRRLREGGRLASHFDVVIASCEIGVCKPDPKIFRTCLDAISVEPRDALFVDDHPPNVAAADALGMRTLLFQGDGSIERLRSLLEV
jgi:putative hydrolase of the HAD superfamily